MKNEKTHIGLFQGMFENNILTLTQVGMKMVKLLAHLMMSEKFKNI